MINVDENKMVSGRELHKFVEVKTRYTDWVERCIEYVELKDGKDFYSKLSKSTGGRQATDYQFTLDAAKEICIVSATPRAKELRRWLIGLSNQRENLELVTVKEAAFAFKVINCLKFIENQKEAYSLHRTTFVKENNKTINPRFIYGEFAKYRAKIVGWDKETTDKAISQYINDHSGYNRSSVMKSSMSDKHSIMDIGEAIRIAVIDILYAKHEDSDMASNFASLCKRLANEMKVEADKKNETNLFKEKESIDSVRQISLK